MIGKKQISRKGKQEDCKDDNYDILFLHSKRFFHKNKDSDEHLTILKQKRPEGILQAFRV